MQLQSEWKINNNNLTLNDHFNKLCVVFYRFGGRIEEERKWRKMAKNESVCNFLSPH